MGAHPVGGHPHSTYIVTPAAASVGTRTRAALTDSDQHGQACEAISAEAITQDAILDSAESAQQGAD